MESLDLEEIRKEAFLEAKKELLEEFAEDEEVLTKIKEVEIDNI